MRELVLNNHVRDYGRMKSGPLLPTPPQDVRKRFQDADLPLQCREVCGIEGRSVLNLHWRSTEQDAQWLGLGGEGGEADGVRRGRALGAIIAMEAA
jgi:hypothetical protein